MIFQIEMSSDTSVLIGFKAICNFVSNLAQVYERKFKPLKLYNRLISHTQIGHDAAIAKHMTLFRDFCIKNREGIYERDKSKLTNVKLFYSDKVYIDIGAIMGIADSENLELIWKHLLTISAILDPAGKAKSILKQTAEEKKIGNDETAFLTNIVTKIETTLGDQTEPAAAMATMLQSGLITELMEGVQNGMKSGKLDLNRMIGAVQTMMGGLSSGVEADDTQAQQAIGVVNGLVENLQSGQGDPSSLLPMLSSFLGNSVSKEN